MPLSRRLATFTIPIARHSVLASVAFATAALFAVQARAQTPSPSSAPQARVIVVGVGSISAPPDYAEIRSGVTVKAKSAKDATDANSKFMAAITAMLLEAGIEQKDIQTSRFSVQPDYTPPQANTAPKLSGYTVSNQVSVTIHQIAEVGDILDRLVTAGATDIFGVEFLHSDPSQALDQARVAAIADAKRKAALYAQAAGLSLGGVAWITEDTGNAPVLLSPQRATAMSAPVPIASGEDTLRAVVTVGFDLAH